MNLREYNEFYNKMKLLIGTSRKNQRVARAVYMKPSFYKEFNRAYQSFVAKGENRKIVSVEGVPIVLKDFGQDYMIDEA
ncbi:hypothetical protein [Vagococcus lutrae]|uniref:hypothetical protein n=1 Tax=Vagococcus lutrae TaxID=81947 RepID=UPI00288DD95C|nr:hypothetical protein [Vagococcus lutrae]MDT2824838.1 hypothetical protein [Vagococcus lutrae]